MKKYITACLMILLIGGSSYAQSGWFWQNPRPSGTTTRAVEFLNNNTIFIGGESGMLLRSTDTGISWHPMASNLDHFNSIYDIKFINNQYGIILGGSSSFGGSGFIKSSSNFGNTWINRYSGSYRFFRIFVLDSSNIYAISESRVLKSTNFGISWVSILISGHYLRSAAFINQMTGIAVGYDRVSIGGFPPQYYTRSLILRTFNGGSTWTPDSMGNGFQFNDIDFTTDKKGFIAGSAGRVFSTTNGGVNWISVFTSGFDYERILVLDSNRINVLSTSSLAKTSNGGQNWIFQSVGGPNHDVALNSSGTGIIVGDNGKLFRSTNSGSSWTNIQAGVFPSYTDDRLNAVHFVNENFGYAVGRRYISGTYFKTTNGGANWEVNLHSGNNQYDVFFVNETTGFIANGSGVRKTTNAGSNWVDTFIPISNFISVYFVNSNTGFLAGAAKIGKTTNSGMNWSVTVIPGNFAFEDVDFFNDSIGAVCGGGNPNGSILWTTDQGNTWLTRNSGLSNYTVFNGICLLSKTTAVIAGRDWRILRTSNSGVNWSVVYGSSSSLSYNEVCFKDSLNGIVVGNAGVIMRTSNGGLNWIEDQSSTTANLYDCALAGQNNYEVVGHSFSILGTTNVYTIGIQPISSEIPGNFVLSQNYPNPFNPQTKIKFDVPKASITRLIIYDLLGREVTTLVNDELRPGTYEADWDASSFSSGVYFYRIISGEFVETKKMVLMK